MCCRKFVVLPFVLMSFRQILQFAFAPMGFFVKYFQTAEAFLVLGIIEHTQQQNRLVCKEKRLAEAERKIDYYQN